MGITESRAVLGGLSTLPVHEGGAKSWEMRRKMKERSWEIRDEWIEIKTKRQGDTLGACKSYSETSDYGRVYVYGYNAGIHILYPAS